jgi:hypothetical protein
MVNVFYEESTFKYVKKILLSISVTQSAWRLRMIIR